MQTDTDVESPVLVEAPPQPVAAEPAPAAARRPKRRRRGVLTIALLGAAIVATTLWIVFHTGANANVLEASGTVEATDATLGFAAGGRIQSIAVREGELARSGAVLAELDTSELMAHLRQLRDQAALADAQLRDLQVGARPQELENLREAVTSARRSLDDAESDLGRMRPLIVSGAISQQSFDKTQLARDLAASRYAQAQAALSLAEEGARREQLVAARASLSATRAQITALAATIPNYFIHAPWTGLVTNRVHEPGEAVAAGSPVLAVMNPDDRWVRIYIPENEVGAVRVGQNAAIFSDAFPGASFVGHVRWISSEAEFTPRNVQTKDDRVRLVYAAKVQIDRDSAIVLKPGTPADVRVELERK